MVLTSLTSYRALLSGEKEQEKRNAHQPGSTLAFCLGVSLLSTNTQYKCLLNSDIQLQKTTVAPAVTGRSCEVPRLQAAPTSWVFAFIKRVNCCLSLSPQSGRCQGPLVRYVFPPRAHSPGSRSVISVLQTEQLAESD